MEARMHCGVRLGQQKPSFVRISHFRFHFQVAVSAAATAESEAKASAPKKQSMLAQQAWCSNSSSALAALGGCTVTNQSNGSVTLAVFNIVRIV